MRPILACLALIGRRGTQGFALSLLAGLALPQLAAAARPLLGACIFAFVLLTFMRLDLTALRALAARPRQVLLTCACLVGAPVAVVGTALSVVGRENLDGGLVLGLAVLAASPPIMSAPAIAMLLGIEPALILTSVIAITVAAPILSPVLVDLVAGAAVPLDASVLVSRLAGLIGGAVLAAVVLRRVLGVESIRRHGAVCDGVGVVLYFVFAVAAMDGVLTAILAEPGRVARFLGAAVALSCLGFATSWLVLRPVSPPERLVLGYATGQRNMGLLIAALGAGTPRTTFLFFALSQVPIYLGPQMIKLFARRLGAGPDRVAVDG